MEYIVEEKDNKSGGLMLRNVYNRYSVYVNNVTRFYRIKDKLKSRNMPHVVWVQEMGFSGIPIITESKDREYIEQLCAVANENHIRKVIHEDEDTWIEGE